MSLSFLSLICHDGRPQFHSFYETVATVGTVAKRHILGTGGYYSALGVISAKLKCAWSPNTSVHIDRDYKSHSILYIDATLHITWLRPESCVTIFHC